MDELAVLVLKLRMLVDDSRDEEIEGFYHDAGNSSQFAADFDDLDELLQRIYPDWPKK